MLSWNFNHLHPPFISWSVNPQNQVIVCHRTLHCFAWREGILFEIKRKVWESYCCLSIIFTLFLVVYFGGCLGIFEWWPAFSRRISSSSFSIIPLWWWKYRQALIVFLFFLLISDVKTTRMKRTSVWHTRNTDEEVPKNNNIHWSLVIPTFFELETFEGTFLMREEDGQERCQKSVCVCVCLFVVLWVSRLQDTLKLSQCSSHSKQLKEMQRLKEKEDAEKGGRRSHVLKQDIRISGTTNKILKVCKSLTLVPRDPSSSYLSLPMGFHCHVDFDSLKCILFVCRCMLISWCIFVWRLSSTGLTLPDSHLRFFTRIDNNKLCKSRRSIPSISSITIQDPLLPLSSQASWQQVQKLC